MPMSNEILISSSSLLVDTEIRDIRDHIYMVHGVPVMFDYDLAHYYGIETKVLKQTVRRNMDSFPSDFMFSVPLKEYNSLIINMRSQIVTTKRGGIAYAPFAFTEADLVMLSALLKSSIAVEVRLKVMRGFVEMQHFIISNAQVFERLDWMQRHMQETDVHVAQTDEKVNQVLAIIEHNSLPAKEGIFFDGQMWDAYEFVSGLIRKAQKRIIVIDNYVDDSVLTLLDKRSDGVRAVLFTNTESKMFQLDVQKHNMQYAPIEVNRLSVSHDRFMWIDDTLYHIGASLKDLGKKWFAFSEIVDQQTKEQLLQRLNLSDTI